MRSITLIVLSCLFSFTAFSQTVTWSPELVKPKETEVNSTLTFPGAYGNNYYANEYVVGTPLIKRKWKCFVNTVNISTLKLEKQTDLVGELADDGKDYLASGGFINNNKQYTFFLDMDQKDVYDLYSVIQNIDGGNATPIKAIQKVDTKKFTLFKSSASVINHKISKKEKAAIAFYYTEIKPAYDGKSIISATIYETVDDDYSMLNVSEWDDDLKVKVSGNYKIPFLAREKKEKVMFGLGEAKTGSGEQARILDIVKDNNGFVYVLLKSANPKDKDEVGVTWVYQFKLSDPSYMKTYKKELSKNRTSISTNLYQDKSGKVFISSVGIEIEDNKDENDRHRVNAAFIGSFNSDGSLATVFSNRLSPEMMYTFEKEKKVDKNGYINSLRIENVLPSADGGCFVIWQHEWEETKENAVNDRQSFSHEYFHSDNVLVQYYNKANKMVWQKPVYKQQKSKDNVVSIYTELASGIMNDALYIFYPDDPKNADRAIDDKDVSEYSVVKFGNKDLAGMFVAKFDVKGNYTRQYIKWPEDKIGFALCVNSFVYLGNNECIATVRKIRQGALFLKAEEYTFLKFKF
jgi:hypothetical protein